VIAWVEVAKENIAIAAVMNDLSGIIVVTAMGLPAESALRSYSGQVGRRTYIYHSRKGLVTVSHGVSVGPPERPLSEIK
jgi:hypothetical protein